jgi:hypothetical protein
MVLLRASRSQTRYHGCCETQYVGAGCQRPAPSPGPWTSSSEHVQAGESLWTGKYQEGEGAVVVSLGKMSFSEIISCHGTVVNKNCKNQRAGVSRNKLGKGQKGAKTSFAPLMGATVSSEEPRGWVWQNWSPSPRLLHKHGTSRNHEKKGKPVSQGLGVNAAPKPSVQNVLLHLQPCLVMHSGTRSPHPAPRDYSGHNRSKTRQGKPWR